MLLTNQGRNEGRKEASKQASEQASEQVKKLKNYNKNRIISTPPSKKKDHFSWADQLVYYIITQTL